MTSNVLREAINEVKITGKLVENKLDYKTSRQGKNYISGDLLIETTKDNIVPVNFFAFEQKKDGGPNRNYKNMDNVIANYKSVAKVGANEADIVSITGAKLEANEFYNNGGNLISTFRIRSNFVNRVNKNMEPKADFIVELYIQSIVEEVIKDEPTGRYIVNGIVPGYQGRINVLKFFVVEDKAIKYINSNYSVGDTVKVSGKLENEVIEVTRTEEMEFGEDVVDTYTRIKRELIITGGTEPYEEADKFSPDLIKQAMVEREVDLKNKLEQATQKASPNFANNDVVF